MPTYVLTVNQPLQHWKGLMWQAYTSTSRAETALSMPTTTGQGQNWCSLSMKHQINRRSMWTSSSHWKHTRRQPSRGMVQLTAIGPATWGYSTPIVVSTERRWKLSVFGYQTSSYVLQADIVPFYVGHKRDLCETGWPARNDHQPSLFKQ